MPVKDVEPGQRVGDLQIEEELGRGAFASVFRAVNVRTHRTVALKLLRTREGEEAEDDRRRLLREAKIIRQLRSEHIVALYAVHDWGQAGTAFEMEYVDGGTLDRLLAKKKRLPLSEVLRIMRGVLSGLQVAHDHKILHRDIKPGNVLLARNGAVKLADFGLGQRVGDASLSSTGGGRLRGTPLYMSPEVVMGERATFAADIWSAGVLLYHLLSGRLPFRASNLADLFLAIENTTPPPLHPDYPAELRELVTRCLAKRPSDRPGSSAELLAVIDRVVPVQNVAASTPAVHVTDGEELFGREGELQRILGGLVSVQDGRGVTMFVTGAAGIGKSALLREAGRRAVSRGFHWLETVVTSATGLQRPLLDGARRALLGNRDLHELADQITPVRFGAATRALRTLLLDPDAHDAPQRPDTLWAIGQLLAGLARERPVGLVVEDAHLGDVDDLALLSRLELQLADAPLFFAVTYERAEGEDTARTVADIAVLTRQHPDIRLELQSLSPDAMPHVLREHADGATPDADVVERVFAGSGGNPLHAIELWRRVERLGEVREDAGRILRGDAWNPDADPQRIEEILAERLASLAGEDRALLEVAALDLPVFDGTAIAAAFGQPHLEVLRHLQRLYRDTAIVVPRTRGFRFAHESYRKAVQEGMPPARQREIHEAFAEHLASDANGDHADPERLGAHWLAAGKGDRARAPLRRAAMRAAHRQEHRRALRLARASDLRLEDLSPASTLASSDLLFALADCHHWCGEIDRSAAVLERLMAVAGAAGEEQMRLRALVRRNELRRASGAAEPVETAAVEHAAAALTTCEEGGRALLLLASVALEHGQLEDAVRTSGDAAVRFRGLGHTGLLGCALDLRATVEMQAGRHARAEEHFLTAARIASSEDRRTDAAVTNVKRIEAAFCRGALHELEQPLKRSMRALALAGDSRSVAEATLLMGRIRYAAADPLEAEENLSAALNAFRVLRDHGKIASVLLQRARLEANRGRLDRAQDHLAEARASVDRIQDDDLSTRCSLQQMFLHVFSGEPKPAAEAARASMRSVRTGAPALRSEVVICVSEALLLGLPAAIGQELASVRSNLATDVAGPTDISAQLYNAARGMHDSDSETVALAAAAEAFRTPAVGDRQAELQILGDWFRGEVARRSGAKADARAAGDRALSLAERLGHVWLQLRLLGWLDHVAPDHARRDRRHLLLERMATGLGSLEAQTRLIAAWKL